MYIGENGLQFEPKDVWDYSTLGEIITKWLEAFKVNGKHGCPYDYLVRAVGEKLEYSDEDIEKGLELLFKDIDDLIWALDDNNEPYYVNLTHEEQRIGMEQYDATRKEKLAVFGEIYQHLWD